jgi:hypothetical protein
MFSFFDQDVIRDHWNRATRFGLGKVTKMLKNRQIMHWKSDQNVKKNQILPWRRGQVVSSQSAELLVVRSNSAF